MGMKFKGSEGEVSRKFRVRYVRFDNLEVDLQFLMIKELIYIFYDKRGQKVYFEKLRA